MYDFILLLTVKSECLGGVVIVNRLGVPNDLASDCFQNKNNTCSSNCFIACDNPPGLCHSTCSLTSRERKEETTPVYTADVPDLGRSAGAFAED
ncbi:hypothetical protein ACTXT7_000182 [Hymenolepis weldensis]